MKLNKLIALPVLTAAFALAAPQAQAADNTRVDLQINDYVALSTSAPSVVVEPSLSEISTANAATRVNLFNLIIDSTNGAVVTLDGDGSDGTNGTLADTDLEIGNKGTWVRADNNNATVLHQSNVAQNQHEVPLSVRISNLRNYSVGTHSNTVTFTVTSAAGGGLD